MQKGLEKNSNYYNRSWNHLQEYLWQVAVVAQNEMHCYNLQTRWAQEPRWLQRSWANAGGWCRWKGRARAQPGLWAGGSAQRCWAPQSSLQSLGRYLTSSNTSDPSVYVSNFSFVFPFLPKARERNHRLVSSLLLVSAHGKTMQENKSSHISPWSCKILQATRQKTSLASAFAMVP